MGLQAEEAGLHSSQVEGAGHHSSHHEEVGGSYPEVVGVVEHTDKEVDNNLFKRKE